MKIRDIDVLLSMRLPSDQVDAVSTELEHHGWFQEAAVSNSGWFASSMYRFREWKPVSWFRVVAGVVIGAILLSYAAFLFFEHKAGRSLIEWGPRTLVFTVVLASVGITLGLLSRSRFVREWIFELVLLALLVVLLLALVGKPPWGSSEILILLGHSLIGVVIIRCLTPFRLAVTILTGGLALVVFLFMPKGQNTFRLFWPRWFSRAGRVSVREAYLAGLDEPTRKHP